MVRNVKGISLASTLQQTERTSRVPAYLLVFLLGVIIGALLFR